MPVVSFLNQKGGVGKTTSCFHLAGAMAAIGRRVLLVDNDPQASLTQGFIGPTEMRRLPRGETVAAVYHGDDPYPAKVIRPVLPNVDLLPGSPHVKPFNVPEPMRADRAVQWCLREFLGEAQAAYDYVFIDCPPNLHLCGWAALAASDDLVVPLQPEDYGAQGIADVKDSYELVRARCNPALVLSGYLLNRVGARKAVHRKYEETLRQIYGGLVFATVLPDAVDFVEAIAVRTPVTSYRRTGAAAKAVLALAAELEARLAAGRAA